MGIFDALGEEVVLTQSKPANSSLVLERIESVLENGESYSAELTIEHRHVPGEVFITFIGIGKWFLAIVKQFVIGYHYQIIPSLVLLKGPPCKVSYPRPLVSYK